MPFRQRFASRGPGTELACTMICLTDVSGIILQGQLITAEDRKRRKQEARTTVKTPISKTPPARAFYFSWPTPLKLGS